MYNNVDVCLYYAICVHEKKKRELKVIIAGHFRPLRPAAVTVLDCAKIEFLHVPDVDDASSDSAFDQTQPTQMCASKYVCRIGNYAVRYPRCQGPDLLCSPLPMPISFVDQKSLGIWGQGLCGTQRDYSSRGDGILRVE